MKPINEPITIYGLLAGESGVWTLEDIDEAMRTLCNTELVYGMAVVSRLGMAFQMAFGGADMRLKRIAGTMAAVGTEIERRGGDPFQINLDLGWEHWCRMVREHGPESAAIPSHRIAELRHTIHQAIPLLGDSADSAMAKDALIQAATAIDALLASRGFTGEAHSGDRHQA